MSDEFVFSFLPSPHDLATRHLRSTDDELHREDLAGDEVMVQGIDCTSVSPWTRSFYGFGAR